MMFLQKELEKVDIRLKELYGSQGPRLRDSEEVSVGL